MQNLFQENFNPKSYASSVIQSQMVGETLAKLSDGITQLDKELYSQVVTNYEDLLSQATGIEALESQAMNILIVFSGCELVFFDVVNQYEGKSRNPSEICHREMSWSKFAMLHPLYIRRCSQDDAHPN